MMGAAGGSSQPRYDLTPHYPVVGGGVAVGYDALVADVVAPGRSVLAIDGPAAVDWESLVGSLLTALRAAGLRAHCSDVRERLLSWPQVERSTVGGTLRNDAEFARLCDLPLERFFNEAPRRAERPSGTDLTVVFGPGAGLMTCDRLWYAGLPKRLATEALRDGAPNLGQRSGQHGTMRRMSFVDWPVQDRHARELVGGVDRYLDATIPDTPRSVDGNALRASLRELARGPFRTRPVFLPGAWGGQWLRRVLGVATEAPNLAWSYELITPESGIVLGDRDLVEVGFELLMAVAGEDVVGTEVARRFGTSFPIRFDYLDTVDGANLSVHCHPRPDYMREVFGWPYTQHESYYVMATRPGATVFLGLREDADLGEFHSEAERAAAAGVPFDVGRYVEQFPSRAHQLYLIPAGTPHASGEGNVVLEISSTPYLYSLRFYDWLRADLTGDLRPVHVEHAFANVNRSRRGTQVRDQLVREPKVVRSEPGLTELELGRHPELFFAVHRLDFDDRAEDDTAGRFHVLNLVAGDAVTVETAAGRVHRLAYAETLVMPASVGHYRLTRTTGGPCKVVKALVVDA
jgi:mannose-6-phosphate isomerase class I